MNGQDQTLRHCVIGEGRLGSTLLAALRAAGHPVAAVAVRGGAARPQAAPPRLPLAEAVALADVLWFTVPDDAIHTVAEDAALALRALPPRHTPPLYAIHCSGSGRLSLLDPLRASGAHALSIHPLQTFAFSTWGDGSSAGEAAADGRAAAGSNAEPASQSGAGNAAAGDAARAALLRGVPAAVTAAGEADATMGEDLAGSLGLHPFRLEDEAKPLYHLAATAASNLLVALESEATTLMNDATGRKDGLALLAPLVETTLTNLLREGPSRALTGPVARGDVGTVRGHLRLLDGERPRLAGAYRALSLEALTLAAPRLDDEAVRTLKDLLERGRR